MLKGRLKLEDFWAFHAKYALYVILAVENDRFRNLVFSTVVNFVSCKNEGLAFYSLR